MSEAEPTRALGEIGEDRLLDGRLILSQPRKGHRAGSDAVLLAAALPELGEGPLLDLGAGVGTVGLAAALQQPHLGVTLLERDPELAALARRNAALNGWEDRVGVVTCDLNASAAALAEAGLTAGTFACVAMNPPFYAPGETRASPVPNRRAAHVVDQDLAPWFRVARRSLRPAGSLALIHRADALPQVMAGLATGFGAIRVRPVHAHPGRPAIRILVTAVLNSKRPAEILPAFTLHDEEGARSAPSEALHRGRLSLAHQ
jgi:tRNA1(Val) A37 N6-methylase TrmN6